MLVFNKEEIKESITLDHIFELLQEWGGDPVYASWGLLSHTICHNPPGEGSQKLYYYSNSGLFKCYTGCPEAYFDIFELVIKVQKIQNDKDFDLNDAVRWIAARLGISGAEEDAPKEEQLEDWKKIANYERIQNIELETKNIVLKEYDRDILYRFNYDVRIEPWENEGISDEVIKSNDIGFYPGLWQITIPHFDQNARFIGLRGRTLVKEDAERYGKYRPMKVNGVLYNHPLGMNLYNLNNSKKRIKEVGKAIVFEGEKSCLLYQSYFGVENDISVACCGSNVSAYQMYLLQEAGASEIIIAFDRQFQEIGDAEFKHLTTNLTRLHDKYKTNVMVSFIFDKNKITGYKDSPIDCGPNIFYKLFKERIIL